MRKFAKSYTKMKICHNFKLGRPKIQAHFYKLTGIAVPRPPKKSDKLQFVAQAATSLTLNSHSV